ncbi:MAG: CDP-alcohol phosphatidyltransferase family protein [Mariprofundaceae bacterium]|nr:CDP-alcohol phosphatidyltransferase family protein [Mariprofundaceae bacterium]
MAQCVGFERIWLVAEEQQSEKLHEALAGSDACVMSFADLKLAEMSGAVLVLVACFLPESVFLQNIIQQEFPDNQCYASENALLLPATSLHACLQTFPNAASSRTLFDHIRASISEAHWGALETQGMAIRQQVDQQAAESILLAGLIKESDGPLARLINRRISLAVTRRLMNTQITPDQMTWLNLVIGLFAALCFAVPTHGFQVLGGALFLAHSILDGCDGELARLKFMESRRGGLFDFWSDNIVHAAVFTAMGVAWYITAASGWALLCSFLAVGGALVSATLIYMHSMRGKAASGPLYTSVSKAKETSTLARIADLLSRRDFIYLVLLLAIVNKTHWFLIITAIGAPVYAALLLFVIRRDSRC